MYVEKTPFTGGSVSSLYELVRGLDTRLFEPIVLFHRPNPDRDRFRSLGVRVITLYNQKAEPSSGFRRSIGRVLRSGDRNDHCTVYRIAREIYVLGARDWVVARRFTRLIKDERIDLVHHNNSLKTNRATVMGCRMASVPQVCHMRGFREFSLIERCLLRFVDAFIYNSRAVRNHNQNQGVPASRGQVIYNPINVEAFQVPNLAAGLRAEFGLTRQDLLVTNVGRITWWKGQDYFLQAMAEVKRSLPNAKALIVGSDQGVATDVAYHSKLEKLVSDLNLSDCVKFTGFRTDIPRIMAASDVVVHSSSEPEPFGRVIVEAMAAGCPVVATAAGGVPEIIENLSSGLLVPPKNVEKMATAIVHLLQNQKQVRSACQQAQKLVGERFSVRQHVTQVQHLYQKLCTQHKLRSGTLSGGIIPREYPSSGQI